MEQLEKLQYQTSLIKKSQQVERSSSLRIERPTSLAVRPKVKRRNSLPSPTVIGSIVRSSSLERVRSFSLTRDGLKNCGDKFRPHSVCSAGTSDGYESCSTGATSSMESICPKQQLRVAIIGSKGVGKKSLKNQFATSEELYINNYDIKDQDGICVLMDDEESYVMFVDEAELANQAENELVDSIVVVFSVVDAKSFKNGIIKIEMLRQEIGFDKPLFLVANKVDLARQRIVTEKDAKKVATRYNCKYIETSVALNHNVDQLLAGIIRQVRSRRHSYSNNTDGDLTKDPKTASMFTKILLQKLMKIGHHEFSCTKLFDV
ncbi:GTP-binding protein GEM-like [Saccostrea echinata]|uniref:GTP-binding protein GEM-like n=1 Tax=Saccostrea echinata TaxID=191078 RepID=UPI002A805F25|nr:GTP-binding protein GEM-like [Saccostrea echinata]